MWKDGIKVKKIRLVSMILVIILVGILTGCKTSKTGQIKPVENNGQTTQPSNTDTKPSEIPSDTDSTGSEAKPAPAATLKDYNGYWEVKNSKINTTMKIEAVNESLIKVSIASAYNNGNKLPEADFQCKITNGSGNVEFVDSFDNKLEFKIKFEKTSILVETKLLERGQGYNIEEGSLAFTKKM